MAIPYPFRIWQQTTTTGTGTITLSGSDAALRTFNQGLGSSAVVHYVIEGVGLYEAGVGVFTNSGSTLPRPAGGVMISSNGGGLVNLPSGAKDVFVTFPGEPAYILSFSGNHSMAVTDHSYRFMFTGSSAGTLTLPLLAATPDGFGVPVINTGTALLVIDGNGSEQVQLNTAAAESSIYLYPGQTAMVIKASGSLWRIFSGFAQKMLGPQDFGADETGTNDSGAALQSWLNFYDKKPLARIERPGIFACHRPLIARCGLVDFGGSRVDFNSAAIGNTADLITINPIEPVDSAETYHAVENLHIEADQAGRDAIRAVHGFPTFRNISVHGSYQDVIGLMANSTATYLFTITAGSATVGATYTNNGQTFTVVNTISGAVLLTCTGTGAPAASGTLTKSAGTGDATVTFSAYTSRGGYFENTLIEQVRAWEVGRHFVHATIDPAGSDFSFFNRSTIRKCTFRGIGRVTADANAVAVTFTSAVSSLAEKCGGMVIEDCLFDGIKTGSLANDGLGDCVRIRRNGGSNENVEGLTFVNSDVESTSGTYSPQKHLINIDSGITVTDVLTSMITRSGWCDDYPATLQANRSARLYRPHEEAREWTPTIFGSTTAGSHTYHGNTNGQYWVEGPLVIAHGFVQLTAKDAGMAGNVSIGGLPLTADRAYSCAVGRCTGLTYGGSLLCLDVVNGTKTAVFVTSASGAGAANLASSAVVGTTSIGFILIYFRAAS